MKRFKVLTMFILLGMTFGQPISNQPTEKSHLIKSEEMLQLARKSMEKSAHTYGMNLSSNLGYVWNNIGYRTPILHNVGNPDQKYDIPHKSVETPEKKPPQILEELLNYEDFWKWLSDWTTLYMQALSDYLSKEIRDEIAKEVQMYFSILETGDYLKKMDKINADRVRDQLYLEVKHKLIEEGLITDNKNYKTDLKKEINEVIHKELEMLKKRKDKDEKRPNQIEKHRIEADKIYGNSFGNEKVINIYIFNPNKDSNEVIEELKPITDGVVNGTYTFGEHETIVINEDKKETEDPMSETGNEDAEVIQAEDNEK